MWNRERKAKKMVFGSLDNQALKHYLKRNVIFFFIITHTYLEIFRNNYSICGGGQLSELTPLLCMLWPKCKNKEKQCALTFKDNYTELKF